MVRTSRKRNREIMQPLMFSAGVRHAYTLATRPDSQGAANTMHPSGGTCCGSSRFYDRSGYSWSSHKAEELSLPKRPRTFNELVTGAAGELLIANTGCLNVGN